MHLPPIDPFILSQYLQIQQKNQTFGSFLKRKRRKERKRLDRRHCLDWTEASGAEQSKDMVGWEGIGGARK